MDGEAELRPTFCPHPFFFFYSVSAALMRYVAYLMIVGRPLIFSLDEGKV